MEKRILGFDVARAYAIFGMLIVNFNFAFGAFGDTSPLGRFQNLFVGNSTSIFITLAGAGLSLMTKRGLDNPVERKKLQAIVLKRSWFLFAVGLLLYSWWPGDILHFYGGYMHIAAFFLFVNKRYYSLIALFAIVIFHALLFVIPIGTGWDFNTTKYTDFWTLTGFLRATIYNGWNSIFPWIAFFMLGMWLGRLNWQNTKTRRNVFFTGAFFFINFEVLRLFARNNCFSDNTAQYILSEYFPPYLPFMGITASYALMVISVCLYLGERFSNSHLTAYLAATGRMTLTHYVGHLTLGMLLLAKLTNKVYTGYWKNDPPLPPAYILLYSFSFFVLIVIFSVIWSRKFKNGPLEFLMRKFSNG